MPEDKRAPILCFDGDAAGQRAASRALDRILPILKPDHSVKFAFLPEQHDPDSLIKDEGVGAMQRVLDNAISLFEMMWQEEAKGRNLGAPETKAGFRTALIKRARQIPDMSLQEFFIYEVNQKINEVFLKDGYSGKQRQQRAFAPSFKGKPQLPGAHTPYRPIVNKVNPIKVSRLLKEKALIAVMINYPELFDEFGEQFGMLPIPNAEYDQLRQAVITLLAGQNNHEINLDDQAVKQHLIESGHGRILEAVFDKALYLHAGFAKPGQPVETVRQGWRETWERCRIKPRSA